MKLVSGEKLNQKEAGTHSFEIIKDCDHENIYEQIASIPL